MKDNTSELIEKLFLSRDDVYAVQTENGEYISIKGKITPELIERHLKGEITLGVYTLDKNSMIKWNCFDIDKNKEDAKELYRYLKTHEKYHQACALEVTGGRGWHIWQFFKEKIPAGVGIEIGKGIMKKLKLNCELYPKQESIDSSGLGNLVKLPWGVHRKYNRPSFFIDPTDLNEIRPILVDINLIKPIRAPLSEEAEVIPFIGCIALDRINRGIEEGCRDEAAFFKTRLYFMIGSPRDETEAALKVWNEKNKLPLSVKSLLEKVKSVYTRKRYHVSSWSLRSNTLLGHFCESCVNPICEKRRTSSLQREQTLEVI